MDDSKQLVALVTELEMALAIVGQRLQDQKVGIALQNVELELNVEVKKKVEAGVKFDVVVPVDTSASTEWKNKHTMTLSLTPTKTMKLGKPEHEELADAIFALATATGQVKKAASPNFALNGATLSMEVGVNKEGKLQVIAGPGGGTESSHKIKLTFRPD
jgi:hypothetical protein